MMTQKIVRTRNIFAVTLVAFLAACGAKNEGKSGNDVKSGAQASKSALLSNKKNAKKSATPPKAIPGVMSGGSAMVAAPATQQASDDGDEAWNFEEIDVDGDGEDEAGDVMFDEETETLFVWYSDADDFGGGEEIPYNALIWIGADDSVGFILEAQGEVLACAADASGASGCIYCDASGQCQELGTDGDIGGEEESVEDGVPANEGDESEEGV